METIVLATDGSPSAAEATKRALELARALEATLVVVAVEHVTVPSYGYYGYAEVLDELRKIEHAHVDDVLEHVKKAAIEAGVECEVVHTAGSIAEKICGLAESREAEIIVVGAHGWGSVRRLLHGSVSSAVLHDAPCPVLVVRGQDELPERALELPIEEARR
jgi:nucleotide-binding universal stress UspA family protein